jgi:hemoglobin-like flavoprotein
VSETGGNAVDPQAMAAAKRSYDRCCTVPHFFEDFYKNFFTRCPQARPMFANTDFERQHKLLRHAFGLLLNFPQQRAGEPTILTRVAERHSRRDLGVDPSLYQPFIEALIDTVRHCDPNFTHAVEDAWRRTVHQGVAYMQAKY